MYLCLALIYVRDVFVFRGYMYYSFLHMMRCSLYLSLKSLGLV